MKKWFARLQLSRQIALVCGVFIFIPMLLLWSVIIQSARNRAVEASIRAAQTERDSFMAQADRVAELCNLSTQVFLNMPSLTEHLAALRAGHEPEAAELLAFYREDIASLEKIIISNPDLYQIRVYALADDIREMMPILYGAERMQRMPWSESGGGYSSGSWYLDFDDQLFPEYPVTHHIMSLVTDIADGGEQVGVLEVSVSMEEILPTLFSSEADSWSVLLDDSGGVRAGTAYMEESDIQLVPLSDDPILLTIGGRRLLTVRTPVRGLGSTYLQVTDVSDIYAAAAGQAFWLFAVFIATTALMAAAVSVLTRRILRGFYGAFDGIRAFAAGDMDAAVTVTGEGEIADFAREAGGLLDQLRRSLRDNLEREAQIQRAETRALQNQINAHFIYNVLEAIKMMAEIAEEYEISDAVTTLGKLLRYSMKLEGGGVEMEREIDYIRNYVDLMNLRFDHTITLTVDVPQELMEMQIPKVSLQPIVENAVVHGAAALSADSRVYLYGEIDAEHGRCSIRITDEGQGMNEEMLEKLKRRITGEEADPHTSGGNGIGLKNVQDRIQLFFGPEYGLRVESEPGAGTTVTVELPYRKPQRSADDKPPLLSGGEKEERQ